MSSESHQELIELIAKALVEWAVAKEERTGTPRGECVRNMVVGDLASISAKAVEQHANGRLAELREWQIRVATALGMCEECELCAGDGRSHEPDLTARAEKAEAAIARVEALRARMVARGSHEAEFVRAALEGEA